MTTNFPTSLDAFTNPSATDAMDSVTVPHATQHADLNDAVEALQAKVGVDGSAVTTSLDYKVDLGLPQGLLYRYATSGDVTFGTSASQLMSVTFTLSTSRKILLMGIVPLIDNTSAAMQIGVWLTDDNTVPLSGAYQATYNNVPSSGYSFDTTVVTGRTFTAGTYTVYTMAFTTTGTARMNNAGGYRYAEMLVYDMGAG